MLRILGRRTSANVMKPLWVCGELGVEYEQVDIGGPFGGNDDPGYRAKNPMGLVPTLEDDGFVMFESNAITRYLCEKHGQGSLWPEDPRVRATADTWMDWKISALVPMMNPLFRGMVRTPEAERDMDEINAAIERGYVLWGMLDRHLEGRTWVAGYDFTMGDIPLGPQAFRWFELAPARPAMPHLEAWYQRLTERPVFREVCMNPMV